MITDKEIEYIMDSDQVEEDEECTHEEYEHGRCVACGEEYQPDDFTGATPGDR